MSTKMSKSIRAKGACILLDNLNETKGKCISREKDSVTDKIYKPAKLTIPRSERSILVQEPI